MSRDDAILLDFVNAARLIQQGLFKVVPLTRTVMLSAAGGLAARYRK